MATKILRLQSANVKRLVAVDIRPDGSIVSIGGRNGAGKSSVLDSIMMALGGAKTIPAEPIRKGQRKARTVVELDNGLTITRTFDAGGSGSKLEVKAAGEHGSAVVKSPQAILDKLVGAISFDPLEYSRKDPKDQAALLRTVAGVDTFELDTKRAAIFDERTAGNRDLKTKRAQLDATPFHRDAPAEPVSVAALTDELERMRQQTNANDQQRAIVDELERRWASLDAAVDSIEQQIDHAAEQVRIANVKLEDARQRSKAAERDRDAAEQEHARALAATAALVDPDPGPTTEKIRGSEDINRWVRDNEARRALEAEVARLERQAEKRTADIEAIDEQRVALLAGAKFPIPGIGFDADGVTLNDVPLKQASQAEQIRMSVAIGLALNPELRVLLVRDGSLLDDDSLKLLADMAEAGNAQVWLERVSSDGAGCSVVIEDGHVRGAPAAADDDEAAQ